MNYVFDLCVLVLVKMAEIFNMTYKEINVWVFVIIWPIFTLVLIFIIIRQYIQIKKMKLLYVKEDEK